MWIYNESGYLMYVDLRQVETCRFCGCKFHRNIEFQSCDGEISNDECPNCGFVHNTSTVFRFQNRKVAAIS